MKPAHNHVEGLRPRHCAEPNCKALFAVCASCDRGQRYCSESCRSSQRRRQIRAAGRRYQAGDAGREAHRRRQEAYRGRALQPSVTHQAVATIAKPPFPQRPQLDRCAVCGQFNAWTNPFYRLNPRRVIRRRSAKVQKTTFSRDR